MDTARFGAILKAKRQEQGKLMHQVGRDLNISESCVCRYESSKRHIPIDLLVTWALLLGARETLNSLCADCPVRRADNDKIS